MVPTNLRINSLQKILGLERGCRTARVFTDVRAWCWGRYGSRLQIFEHVRSGFELHNSSRSG